MTLLVNGRERIVEELPSPTTLSLVLDALGMRADRVAVELNGDLASRTRWSEIAVQSGDKLEIVHFVGGGRR